MLLIEIYLFPSLMTTIKKEIGREMSTLMWLILLIVKGDTGAYKNDEEGFQRWFNELLKCDLDMLLKLAVHHGLTGWLGVGLNKDSKKSFDIDQNFIRKVDSITAINTFNYRFQLAAANTISENFVTAELNHLFFKGPALTGQVYPEKLAMRVSDDLDILISHNDIGKAIQILGELGYVVKGLEEDECLDIDSISHFIENHSNHLRGRDIGFVSTALPARNIDLHWKLVDDFSFYSDTGALLSTKELINTNLGQLSTLPINSHFVYLCAHGYSDCFFRLKSLVDIFVIMNHDAFDVVEVLDIAQHHGVVSQVNTSMRLVRYFFCGNDYPIAIDKYGKRFAERLIKYDGLTPRIHPNNANWTRWDKVKYLFWQTDHRSSKASITSPLQARAKIKLSELGGWVPGETSLATLYLKRLWKSD